MMQGVKILYVILATLSLITGIIGIIVPGLPTTVFLLFAATMYFHGNKKLHDKLLANRYLGDYIKRFREGQGMSSREKIISLLMMWIMIVIAIQAGSQNFRIAMIILGAIGTICVLFFVPIYRKFFKNK
jgi:uncharacterized membrane protein YbaN (DUF454 family)